MLKIPSEYDRDTSSAKIQGHFSKLIASLLGVCAGTRKVWWMNPELLEIESRSEQCIRAVGRHFKHL
jgi:hypothetical protein